MKTAARLAAIALLILTGSAAVAQGGRNRLPRTANPSAVVAAESAFARLAQDKGLWKAFEETAADGAVMFTPQRVLARDWLKGRKSPAQAVQWQPHDVWMSCDGTYAVSHGAWQNGDTAGEFVTVWQRQKNGDYKWLLDQGGALAQPLPQPEMISGRVATCRAGVGGASGKSLAALPVADPAAAASGDQTLEWRTEVHPDGSRTFTARRWTGEAFEEVLHTDFAAG